MLMLRKLQYLLVPLGTNKVNPPGHLGKRLENIVSCKWTP